MSVSLNSPENWLYRIAGLSRVAGTVTWEPAMRRGETIGFGTSVHSLTGCSKDCLDATRLQDECAVLRDVLLKKCCLLHLLRGGRY